MFRKKSKLLKRKRGVTLILALMVMSAIVAVGITIAAIVVFQTKVNSVVTQSHQGYYIAESGMEQALNIVSTLRSGSMSDAITALNTWSTPTEGTTGQTPDGGNFRLDLSLSRVESSGTSQPGELKQNHSTYIELYNVDSSLTVLSAAPQLCVYADGVDTTHDEVLEVSWVGWTTLSGGTFNVSSPQKVLVGYLQFNNGACPIPGTTYNGASIPITQFYPAFNGTFAGFRIRITALQPTNNGNGDVKNLTIYTQPSVTSQLRLKTTSATTLSGQQQALIAIVPWAVPLSSLFDFVIFSEQTLVKNKPITKTDDILRFGPYSAWQNWKEVCYVGATNCQGNPDQAINPFLNCTASTPCSIYVRLYNNLGALQNIGAVGMSDGTDPPTPTQTQNIGDIPANSTCIMPQPFTFRNGGSPPSPNLNQIKFQNIVGLPLATLQYELLNHLTFRDPTEGYCP
jgi:Tfp pilus assembly protein PilX